MCTRALREKRVGLLQKWIKYFVVLCDFVNGVFLSRFSKAKTLNNYGKKQWHFLNHFSQQNGLCFKDLEQKLFSFNMGG